MLWPRLKEFMNSSVSSVSYLNILCWLFLITSARWLPLTCLRLIDKLMMAMCLTSSMFSFGPEQAAELEHTFATALHVAGTGNWGLTWLTWVPKFPQFCSPFCVISRNMRSSYSPAPICQLPTAGGGGYTLVGTDPGGSEIWRMDRISADPHLHSEENLP